MSRESTKAALDRYFTGLGKAQSKVPRKNQKPEFTLTVVPCLEWLRGNGWSVDIVEAKATYSESAGRYLEGQTEAGMSDIVGCDPDGMGAFIEAKAPGKRSTLRPSQRDFLTDKIKCGAFAIVADTVESLERQYLGWNTARAINGHREYLLAQLPPIPKRYQQTVDPELGF